MCCCRNIGTILILPILAAALVSTPPAPIAADIAWVAEGGFCEPETVLPLPDNTLLVSNVCGINESGKGYLTLLDAEGQAIEWRLVVGLDSPLGMTLSGDQLYVVDNNRVKVFRWPQFEPIETIELETSVANDIAVAPDGTIYVTDTAKHHVVQRLPDDTRSILSGESQFRLANGIELHGKWLYVGGERLWRVEFESDDTLQITPVAGPLIRYRSDDEIEILAGPGVSSANHGFAPALGLALIPTGYDNTVIAIRIPGEAESDQ